ncbi:MAG: hypothetical protein LBE06_02550 [Azoarcus sp.]|jgi:hypothetical protein|nr:hypothetical protein [Azoarcus sp.]
MQAYKLNTHIPANHRLEIALPERFPDGEAEVIVLARQQPSNTDTQARPVHALEDFFVWLDRQPPGPHSEEEIEAWIREERNAWGDD